MGGASLRRAPPIIGKNLYSGNMTTTNAPSILAVGGGLSGIVHSHELALGGSFVPFSSSPTSALWGYSTGTSEPEILAVVRDTAGAVPDPVTRGGMDTLIVAHPRAASKNPLFVRT